jgi:hypothetical protein
MVGDVEVDEFTAVVAKDDEHAQQAEGEGRDDEEVDGDDVSGMGGPANHEDRRSPPGSGMASELRLYRIRGGGG